MAFFDLNRNNRYFYYVMFIVLILICFYGYQNIEKFNKKTYKISKFLENSDDITVFGRIYNVKQKEKTIELYIDKVSLNNRKEICKNADKILLIYYKKDNNEKKSDLEVGKYISAKGRALKFTKVDNEGVFDEKKYYYSLKIQGKIVFENYVIYDEKEAENIIFNKLYNLKLKLNKN